MFRFFRRKKSKEENKVSQESVAAPEFEQLEEAEAVELVEREQDVQTPEALVTVSSHEPEEVVVESSSPPPAELESTPASSPTSEAAQVSVEERVFDSDSEPTVTDSAEDAIVASDAGLATSPETTEKLALAPVAEVVEEQSVQETAPKASWMQRLRQGLSRTGSNIGALFVGVKVDEELFEELETALLMADAGIEATESLLTKLRAKVKQQRIEEGEQVKEALKELLTEHLKPLEKSFMLPLDGTSVVMIAGVNGAGKTTSIGKLAHHFQASGASVLLAAGDTFRAAAREQLVEWGKRNNVAVISQDGGDPAAVAFDAVNAGKARQANVVMIDTAGRLPTQLHLMEELKKIKRVINKADNEAPHEVLLVVDGNTGQNVITQIKTFDAALGLTGLVVTKLDGTAKGGTLAAVAAGSQGVRPIPVYWIGVGESLHDLQPFTAAEFATALLG
ncbi:signal recognition particle-docking protein FtsY [Oligella ureolytica]|nr:signal recognition particle-docking protein FtsY [Alcaligenaceae bacterium]